VKLKDEPQKDGGGLGFRPVKVEGE
jgi:hypothetical protein